MDGKALRAQLRKVIKLNEELSRTNAKLTSDLEALVDAAKTLQDDRGRLKKEQRELRQRIEELEAVNRQLTNMLWGRRSERRPLDPDQQQLFPTAEEDEEEVMTSSRPAMKPKRCWTLN